MLGMIQGIFAYVSGPWGVAVIALAVLATAIFAAIHVASPRAPLLTFVLGAAGWFLAFIVNTYLQSAGGI